MSGCARTCILWLLGWAGAAAAFYVYLKRFGVLEPQLYMASIGAGLCVAVFVSYVVGVVIAARERSTLLGAVIGTPPQDGKWVAVSGHIRSNTPLRTPLSGQQAIAYEYKIYRMESAGKSGSHEVRYYEGKALAPSTIATRQGSVRLLAVPTLDLASDEVDHPIAVANAQQYIRATTFQTSRTPKDQKIGVEHESTDDDGNFRVDKRPSDADVDLDDCHYDEKSIKQGEVVCAFGLYSQQRGGLIPHVNWAKQGRLMRGDANDVARQLRNRMIKYAIGIVIVAAIAYGIVWLYARFAPPAAATTASADAAIHTRSSRTC